MMMKVVSLALLLAAFAYSQEAVEGEANAADVAERKEKRGISLNLGGQGLEGYSYFGPSNSRGLNYRGYTPITDYGYDGVNYGNGASNFAGGYQQGYQGYNQGSGSYPYRSGGYPTSYSNIRQYQSPVSTTPYGGIGTVGPYGGGFGGYNGLQNGGGFNGLQSAGGFSGLQSPGVYNGIQNGGGYPGGYNRLGSEGFGLGGGGGSGYQGYQQQQGYF